jgi:hypothetical protein
MFSAYFDLLLANLIKAMVSVRPIRGGARTQPSRSSRRETSRSKRGNIDPHEPGKNKSDQRAGRVAALLFSRPSFQRQTLRKCDHHAGDLRGISRECLAGGGEQSRDQNSQPRAMLRIEGIMVLGKIRIAASM